MSVICHKCDLLQVWVDCLCYCVAIACGVMKVMYHTGPHYDLFNILPQESSITQMILIIPGYVFEASILCFANIMQGGQNNTVSFAPMTHDNDNIKSSHLVLHT